MEHQYEQALRLYIQKLTGDLSAAEESYVHKMLADDAAFREIWSSLEKESIALHTEEYLSRIDPEAGLQEIKKRQIRTPFPWIKIAAAAAVLIGIAWFLYKPANKQQIAEIKKAEISLVTGNGQSVSLDSTGTIALGNATLHTSGGTLKYTSADTVQNTLQVPAGKNYKLILSDGTEVWLNAATRLRFPFHFSGSSRDVYIDGEAYFKVAKDADHPFVVHTALTSVEVLGTAFNVNTYSAGEVQTALVEGRVITRSANGESQDLKPGYTADYTAGRFATHSFDKEETLSWMNGIYYFHSMPLTALAGMASRFYGIRVIIDEKKFAGVATTGLMDRNKLNDFLNDLQTTAHITYQLSGDELYIK